MKPLIKSSLYFVFLSIILLQFFSQSLAQIHRAQTRQYNKPRRPVFDDEDLSPPGVRYPYEDHNMPSGVAKPYVDSNRAASGETIKVNYDNATWIYSLVSAALVGLSGIFPLLLIRINEPSDNIGSGTTDGEEGRAGEGFGGSRLKQLLSFAVGGLLGDVFLHLLPETWVHIHTEEELRSCGLWVIAGFLSFLLVEKIFPDEHEDQETSLELAEKSVTLISQNGINLSPSSEEQKRNKYKSKSTPVLTNGGDLKHINGKMHENNGVKKLTNGTAKLNQSNSKSKKASEMVNGSTVKNDFKNGFVSHKKIDKTASTNGKHTVIREEKPVAQIKTSGWLNLLANVIDNFTHGLAVAASYSISTKTGLLTTAAVLLHEIPHEIGDFAILLRSGFDRWKAAQAQLITATGGICGAFMALCASSVQEAGNRSSWMLPFTAGGFLYIALVTVLPDLLSEKKPWESLKQMILLLLGISVMSLVTAID